MLISPSVYTQMRFKVKLLKVYNLLYRKLKRGEIIYILFLYANYMLTLS